MNWFRNAGLGMFIHWGVYSVPGFGEWGMFMQGISPQEYDDNYADRFTADHFDPDDWARRAKEAGMEYMVLTAKHHDGFCLFETITTKRNVTCHGPKRDLLREYLNACRKYGLKCGVYFSLPDWSVPAFFNGPQKDPAGWATFLEDIVFAQLCEICSNYGKIDLLWYDNIVNQSGGTILAGGQNFREVATETENKNVHLLTAEDYLSAELNAMVRRFQPDILINDRSLLPEDFYTAEQNLRGPKEAGRTWEACMTMNRHWGYFPSDVYYKSTFDILHAMTAVACGGGHILLNVGPNPHGQLNKYEKERLQAIGEWMKINAESVKGVSGSKISGGTFGCVSEKDDAVYLYIHWPEPDGRIVIPQCTERFRSAKVLGSDKELRLEYLPGRIIIHGGPRFREGQLPVVKLIKQQGE
jgi:alpha-L-fucosidase